MYVYGIVLRDVGKEDVSNSASTFLSCGYILLYWAANMWAEKLVLVGLHLNRVGAQWQFSDRFNTVVPNCIITTGS